MQWRNLNWTGVQSYLKFHYDINKLACAFSYQEKFLEKFPTAGQSEIWEPWPAVNLTQSVNIHSSIFWAQRKLSVRKAIYECRRERLAVPLLLDI